MKKTFAYHKPSGASLPKIEKLREAFSLLHEMVEELAPHSRERAEALTHLESSGMWAIKAVVTNDPNAEIDYGAGGQS